MGAIIVLPEEVSSKIAAGEVIDGPYSIVRELIDNSLDADATQIKVTVNNGGKDFILVSDNGSGMSKDDVVLAVQKHTTSKITNIEDLDTLTTMGFRGEAFSSICTVSDFTLLTKREEDDIGTKLAYSFGKDFVNEPAAANKGTEITVKNLFYNLPARRKFLKSNKAENARIKDEILKKALSFFERGFSLKADDRVIYSLIPRSDYRQRIADIYGQELNENLQDIVHEEDLFTIHVFISNKNSTLSNRRGQFIFINRRPVVERSLFFALNNPARGIVQAGRYVYAFVFIHINPSLIDVNVHPAKKEIKIKIEKKIYSALHKLVEQTLQVKFYPSLSHYEFDGYRTVQEPSIAESMDLFIRNTIEKEPPVLEAVENRPSEPGSQVDIGKRKKDLSEGRLLYRGVLFQTYIIFEGRDFILLIDQHAAHERVLYEKFKESSKNINSVKTLLIPINFTPPRKKYADLLESIDVFKEAGIEIEPFGDESFNILTIPGVIPESREDELLSYLFDEFYEGKINLQAHEIKERFLKLASCRSAIKEGNTINEEEARTLLNDLRSAKIPYVCPHGRPTFVRISKEYFEKAFKRR